MPTFSRYKYIMGDKNIKGHIYALIANVMWGLMSPIGKSALQVFTPLSITTFRIVGACIAFWILSFFVKKEKIESKDRIKIFCAAFFALIFNQGTFIFGLSYTSPINASIVTTTLPIITMIVAAMWLKEPISGKKILGIIMGATGALILILGSQSGGLGNGNIIGDLLCLTAQFSFAFYLTVFKSLTQKYSAITINKWMFLVGALVYLPLSSNQILNINWTLIPTSAYWQVIFIVLGGSFIAYICIMSAQKILRPTVVSMYNYMQPIIASFAAILIGVGVFDWQKGLAIAFVFLGVYFVTFSKSRNDLMNKSQ